MRKERVRFVELRLKFERNKFSDFAVLRVKIHGKQIKQAIKTRDTRE